MSSPGRPITYHTGFWELLYHDKGYSEAFTDYRFQGQTLRRVIMDIGKPPGPHGLTPFHVYVALSRSSRRETIRLLRDFDESLFVSGCCPILRAEGDEGDEEGQGNPERNAG